MRKWLPLTAVCLGTFMLLIDVTIVNVALPDMATDLRTSFSSLQWVIDIYALTLAALLLGAGSIADLVGRRRIYLGGLMLFAVASAASGAAPDPTVLIVARGVQGVGAAAMFATTIALLNSAYQGRDRGTAYGVWGAVSGAAAAAGPILGGLLTQGISWRWIFFVNLPFCVVAILLSLRVLADERPAHAPRVDLAGIATFTAAAGAVTFGLIRASDDGWLSAPVLVPVAAGLAALAAFVLVERRSTHAMLDLALMRRPSFVAILVGSMLLSVAAFAALAYTSLWLQSVLGLGAVSAGLVFLPLSGASFLVAATAGRFLHGTLPRYVVGGGLILIGAGGFLQAVLGAGSSWPALVAGLVVSGVGVGLATPTLVSSAMSAVPLERGGMAAGAVNTARQLGYAFGIAVLGSVFRSRITHVLSERGVARANDVAGALAGGQAGAVVGRAPAASRGRVDGIVHAAFASGLNTVFVVTGVVGVVAGLIVLVLVRPAPAATPAPEAQLSAAH